MVAEVERIYVKNKINQGNRVLYKHTTQPPPTHPSSTATAWSPHQEAHLKTATQNELLSGLLF